MPRDMTTDQAEEIIATTKERGVDEPCNRCGHTQFGLVHSYFLIGQVDNIQQGMPVVAFRCLNCGYLVFHSLETLGLSS